jgi:hypothetical protein
MKRFLVVVLLLPLFAFPQEEKKLNVKFKGFVKSDFFYDTRQTVNVRYGQFMLYPKNEDLDKDGNDINSQSSLNMLSVQTRLAATATGPEVWGATPTGYIEGEFFGSSNVDIYGFRLRHAFVKLQWPKTLLLAGQYWHPMFNVRCYPGTVSFNTGVPFQPFTRNPQIRFKQEFGSFNISATALWQLEFTSNGPFGSSYTYQVNSSVPMFNLRLEFYSKNEDNWNEFLAGASANYKMIVPRLQTDSLYKTNTSISTLGFSGYFKMKVKPITLKINGFFGEDAHDMIMIGGYAVREITDPIRNYVSYTPTSTSAFWVDLHTNGKTFQYGLFAGYTKNHGPSKDLMENPSVYMRGSNIDHVYRVSGRLQYNKNKFRIAPELEYTVAAYATEYGKPLEIVNSKEIANFRVLIGFYYFF